MLKRCFSLTALSPLDGRYSTLLEPLSGLMSENALMKYRARVEVTWLIHLAEAQVLTHNGRTIEFSEQDKKQMNSL